jgi:magnesium chelatase family protein
MVLGRTHAVSLLGLRGAIVEIEADISSNLPNFVLIGLPDAALNEAKDRVRAAATNSGCALPNRRITVNLSPAALPKHGSGFDLAIAVAALAAARSVDAASLEGVLHLGELGLDGRLRPIPGILPAVHAAAQAGFATVMVPAGNIDEARLVPGIRAVGVSSLRDAAIWHGARLGPQPVDPVLPPTQEATEEEPLDLADVVGNAEAVEAMLVAAAGGHHLERAKPCSPRVFPGCFPTLMHRPRWR